MDYSAFYQQLSSLYSSWRKVEVKPVSRELEAVEKQVNGTTSTNLLQLLNLAAGLLVPGEVYCEVGCFQGRSLIAALHNHPDKMAYAVDSFAEMNFQAENAERLAENLTKFNLSDQVFVCAQDFEEFFAELGDLELEDRIGVFFYDAPQDYRSQLNALLLVKPFLSEQAVLIINGSNCEFTRQAIQDFLAVTPEAQPLLDLQEFKHEIYPFLDGVYALAWDHQKLHSQETLAEQNAIAALIQPAVDQEHYLEQLLFDAETLQQSGNSNVAIEKYYQYLLWHPQNLQAWLNLGILFLQQQQFLPAIDALSNAQVLDQSNGLVHFHLGIAFEKSNDLNYAVLAYQTAIVCDPKLSNAYYKLGALFLNQGEVLQAESCFRKLIDVQPNEFIGYFNLGNTLLAQAKIAEAIIAYESAQQLQPNDQAIQSALNQANADLVNPLNLYLECGSLAYKTGKYAEAVTYLQMVLDLDDGHPQASNVLSDCYKSLQQESKAISVLEHSLNLYPNVGNQIALAILLRYLGDIDRAIALIDHALEIFPSSLPLKIEKSLLVPLFYRTRSELIDYRQHFAQGQQFLLEELSNLIAAEKANQPLNINLIITICESNQFFIAYQGLNDLNLQQHHGKLVQQLLKENFSELMQPRHLPPVQDKIRVGYLAETMKKGSLGELYLGWLCHHNREDFELYCYHIGRTTDYVTHEFCQLSDHFYHIPDNLPAITQQIIADQLHILVFPAIGLETTTLMLAGLRLAPVQCTSWCHPVTTGLSSIDYFLSSEAMELPAAQSHYSEKLICLPKIGISFPKPIIQAPNKNRNDFGIPEQTIVYLSCQTVYKYLPQHDFIYPAIAQRVERAKFIFIAHHSPSIAKLFRKRLDQCFANYGLLSDQYCIFLPKMPEADYLALNQAANIFLDTFGWSGGVTTLKAIACDLPIVTCPGEMMRSRHSFGILKTLGVIDTIAQTEQEYIDIAVRLALDTAWRQSIIRQMQQGHSNLYDDKTCVLGLEEFYYQVVQG